MTVVWIFRYILARATVCATITSRHRVLDKKDHTTEASRRADILHCVEPSLDLTPGKGKYVSLPLEKSLFGPTPNHPIIQLCGKKLEIAA